MWGQISTSGFLIILAKAPSQTVDSAQAVKDLSALMVVLKI